MKVGTRLSLFYTVVSSGLIALFGTFYYLQADSILKTSEDNNLSYLAKTVIEYFELDETEVPERAFETEEDYLRNNWVMILSSDLRVLYRSRAAEKLPLEFSSVPPRGVWEAEFSNDSYRSGYEPEANGRFRFRFYTAEVDTGGRIAYYVLTGMSVDSDEKTAVRLRNALWLFLVCALPLIALLGYFFSRYMLRPVSGMTTLMNRITDKNLDERLPVTNAGDELSELSGAINRLFDRLGGSFQLQRQFLTDVSHELKTPLAVIRLKLETALAADRTDPESAGDSAASALEDVYAMNLLVGKLLLLARLDESAGFLKLSPVELNGTLEAVTERITPLAESKGLSVRLSLPPEPVTVRGDADLLFAALSDIAENAVKYTPAGSVSLSLEKREGIAEVGIADTGIGIAEADLGRIFDRFYRAAGHAQEDGGSSRGYGIGLSLAQKIVERHGGDIRVESVPDRGTRFTVGIPLDGK